MNLLDNSSKTILGKVRSLNILNFKLANSFFFLSLTLNYLK